MCLQPTTKYYEINIRTNKEFEFVDNAVDSSDIGPGVVYVRVIEKTFIQLVGIVSIKFHIQRQSQILFWLVYIN